MVSGNKIQTIIGPTKTFGVSSTAICNDIKKVFNLDKSEVKWLLKGWIKTQNKGFDFNKFWQKKFSLFLGSTFGNLMATQPNGNLWHMDYVYSIDRAEDLDIVHRMAERYANRPVNPEYYVHLP